METDKVQAYRDRQTFLGTWRQTKILGISRQTKILSHIKTEIFLGTSKQTNILRHIETLVTSLTSFTVSLNSIPELFIQFFCALFLVFHSNYADLS
jgi:hypothetical protein